MTRIKSNQIIKRVNIKFNKKFPNFDVYKHLCNMAYDWVEGKEITEKYLNDDLPRLDSPLQILASVDILQRFYSSGNHNFCVYDSRLFLEKECENCYFYVLFSKNRIGNDKLRKLYDTMVEELVLNYSYEK